MDQLSYGAHSEDLQPEQSAQPTSTQMGQEYGETDEKEFNLRSPAKKLYQDPAFRHEKVFETMALQCGKIAGTNFMCHSRPHSS
jgi:hypothetical protein